MKVSSFLLRLAACLAVTVTGITLHSCGPSALRGGIPKPTRPMANYVGVNHSTLMDGYNVFQARCVECHSSKVPKAPPIGRYWHSESLADPIYQSLSDADRYSVSEYVRAITKRFHSMEIIPDSEFTL